MVGSSFVDYSPIQSDLFEFMALGQTYSPSLSDFSALVLDGPTYTNLVWLMKPTSSITTTSPSTWYGPGFLVSSVDGIIPLTAIPRAFGSGEGITTLTNGSKAVSVPALPSGAIVNAWYRTTGNGPTGILTITGQTTAGFTIQSTQATDHNDVAYAWSTATRGSGGVFTR